MLVHFSGICIAFLPSFMPTEILMMLSLQVVKTSKLVSNYTLKIMRVTGNAQRDGQAGLVGLLPDFGPDFS